MNNEMTPPLIEMVEEYGIAKWHYGATGEPTAAEKADAIHAEIRQRLTALEAEQRVGVVFDAEPQIRAWVNGTHDQMEFWRRVALSAAESAGLGKTQEEAANLTSYFEGQYDQALKVRDFLLQKIGGLNLAAPTLTPQCLAELQANERRYQELLFAVERKFPDEERHDTALRYIRNAESGANMQAQCAAIDASGREW